MGGLYTACSFDTCNVLQGGGYNSFQCPPFFALEFSARPKLYPTRWPYLRAVCPKFRSLPLPRGTQCAQNDSPACSVFRACTRLMTICSQTPGSMRSTIPCPTACTPNGRSRPCAQASMFYVKSLL